MYPLLTDTIHSGLVSAIPGGPPATYLTLLLRNVGSVKACALVDLLLNWCSRFNTFDTHLLTIPSQAMGIVNMFLLALMSGLVSERTFVSMLEDLWILPFLVALYALPANPNPWLFFVSISYHLFESVLIDSQGLVTGLLSSPYVSRDLSCDVLAERSGLSRTAPIHVG